jgi:hypothetical protein
MPGIVLPDRSTCSKAVITPYTISMPYETTLVWPTVTCKFGKECYPATTTSKHCEV